MTLELAGYDRLHSQHTDRHTSNDQRHGHQGFETLLTRRGEVLVVRMFAGVRDHDRLATAGGESDQAVAKRERHLSDGFLVEPDRRFERQVGQLGSAQIQRARVRIQPLTDQLDDIIQRLAEVVRSRDDLSDISQ